MCFGGDGGFGDGAGAGVAAGVQGDDGDSDYGAGPGWGDDGNSDYGSGPNWGMPPSSVEAALGVPPGQHGVPTSALAQGAISNSDIGKGFAQYASVVAPPLGLFAQAIDWGENPGNISDMGESGAGALDSPKFSYNVSGTPTSESTLTNGATSEPMSNVMAPLIIAKPGPYTPSPADIDSANKLRIERETAYAKQRADAETALLKELSLRDVSSTNNPETRLSEQTPASARFVGLPPTLGQSRHRWA